MFSTQTYRRTLVDLGRRRTRPLDASPTHRTLSRPIYGSPQPDLRELVDEGVAHVRGHARLVGVGVGLGLVYLGLGTFF